jgi:catalase
MPKKTPARTSPAIQTANMPALQKAKAEHTETSAGAMPYNANKPLEHGFDNAIRPPQGAVVTVVATGHRQHAHHQPGRGRWTDTHDQPGRKIGDNQNSLKAGLRGPALLEDFILREKITHFDHERIPERIVHARGSARTAFSSADALAQEIHHAQVLTEAGKQTPVFVRFSTVAGGAARWTHRATCAALP